ncbi:MAG: phosphate ABC transporter substrate-binding protein, partial [Lachnospiraceae bacterium]|nr:phosphate ABC transporter substrate-binding protein [Lachnospiraceae bacterium]
GGRGIFSMQKEKEPDTEDMSAEGVIVMAGSTAMENLSGALAEGFMAAYPNISVTVEFTGSSAGIESVLAGRVDIGNSSRRLRQEELNAGAVEHVAAIDGIAVITHPSNAVEGLTMVQLRDIYTGRIRNWQEAGGADEAIVVVGREAGSGTRSVFEEILDMQDLCAYANEMDSSGAVMARVAATPGAIGYVSIDILGDTVRILALDGRLPTREAIQGGRYRLGRPLIMVTDGEVSQQSAAVREFFSYIRSDEGRQLIESVGLITPPYDECAGKRGL